MYKRIKDKIVHVHILVQIQPFKKKYKYNYTFETVAFVLEKHGPRSLNLVR